MPVVISFCKQTCSSAIIVNVCIVVPAFYCFSVIVDSNIVHLECMFRQPAGVVGTRVAGFNVNALGV